MNGIFFLGCVVASVSLGGSRIADGQLPTRHKTGTPPSSTGNKKEVFPRARLSEEVIDFRLSDDEWDDLCSRMVLSEGQRLRANQLFHNYTEEINLVRDGLVPRIMPIAKGVFQEKQLAKKENRPPSQELMQSSRIRVNRELQKSAMKVWEIHEAFFTLVREVLAEEQYDQYESALRAWHREVMRNPRIGNEGFGRDLGANVDVFAVMYEATEDIPELAPYFDPHWIGGPDDVDFAPIRKQCLALLWQYEGELDENIVGYFRWSRITALKRDGEQSRRDFTRQTLRKWLALHRLNNQIAESMAEIIQQQDANLADRWRDAFYAACFPALYAPIEVDLLYEWIEERMEEIPEDRLNMIRGEYHQFTARRRNMRARTRACLLDLMNRSSEAPPLFSFRCALGDAAARECYAWPKVTELDECVIAQFRDLIDETQQAEYDEARINFTRKIRSTRSSKR